MIDGKNMKTTFYYQIKLFGNTIIMVMIEIQHRGGGGGGEVQRVPGASLL